MFRTTIAFPLSAGSMVSSMLFLRLFSAALSVLLKLSLGREEFFFRILTVSCLVSSAISSGRDSTAFSIPVSMSLMGVERGVTAKQIKDIRTSIRLRI